ncbi:MAG: discoidin domain-containing protein [bacterium]|nr:discoidin domain-containing protein [bacterium]
MKHVLVSLMLVCSLMSSIGATDAVAKPKVHVYGSENNDLYQYLKSKRYKCARYDDIEKMLTEAKKGQAVLVLARNYPKEKTILPEGFYKTAKAKELKVFVEFPDRLTNGKTGAIRGTKKDRCVVGSSVFGKTLPAMRILDAGLYSYVTVPSRTSHVYGAKVAGFDTAVYGLEKTPHVPLLFDDGGVLVCATKISDFNKSRYSPIKAWGVVLGKVLSDLSLVREGEVIKWTPLVRPTHAKHKRVSAKDYRQAVTRGAEWYQKGRFLIHPDWKDHWYSIGVKRASFPVGPPMDLSLPSGDGSLGVMEGHYSYINPDGSQQYRYWLRADCVAETAMTFAMANAAEKSEKKRKIAENLMNFLYETDTFKTKSSKDSGKSSYGLIGWASTHAGIYYGDDNARVVLGSILAAQALNDTKWDNHILKLILGNYRTTGASGFRGSRLLSGRVDKATWQRLMKGTRVNPHPHYESWLWANYLWLYDKTQHKPLLELAKKAIATTMARYPDRWKWTNGIQQERARMILPLAWLVRVDDTDEHRKWLGDVVTDMLKSQMPCGAIREQVGKTGGSYGPTRSNRSYGSTEAPVIYKNGDAVADMLYTSNFALFSLNEAAHATKNPKYEKAVKKLSDFLVRIQSISDARADLDGCWFRAFDFNNWEFYGSNADQGWGAWGTLTGWTQSFITTTLGMRLQKTCFWDLTRKSQVGKDFDRVWKEMLPRPEPPEPKKISHTALNKSVSLVTAPNVSYTASGAKSLSDGKISEPDHASDLWLGFLGDDLKAVIDLGKPQPIRQLSGRFLQSIALGIYLPRKVVFEVSTDGKKFVQVASVALKDVEKGGDTKVHTVTTPSLKATARYVRISAENVKTIPASHPSAGTKAWLFADELIVNLPD